MITLDSLKKRRDDLSLTKTMSASELDLLKERVRDIKKELSNIDGAMMEIDLMIANL